MEAHLKLLKKKYWKTEFSVSSPIIRTHEGDGFKPTVITNDKEPAQAVFAFRLFDKDVEIALSTREQPKMEQIHIDAARLQIVIINFFMNLIMETLDSTAKFAIKAIA